MSEPTRLPKWHPDNPDRPKTKKCSECGDHKVPGVDFDWRSERGIRYPMSACKRCISDRTWGGVYQRKTTVRLPPPEGLKWCNVCKQHRELGEFGRQNRTPDGRAYSCRPCAAARRKAGTEALTSEQRAAFLARRAENEQRLDRQHPETRKRRYLHQAFNLPLEDYERMHAEQGGVCAICRQPERAVRNGVLLDLSVDHDHTCCPQKGRSCGRCVRRLLCGNCNKGLGSFQDDPALLLAAVEYLAATAARPD